LHPRDVANFPPRSSKNILLLPGSPLEPYVLKISEYVNAHHRYFASGFDPCWIVGEGGSSSSASSLANREKF